MDDSQTPTPPVPGAWNVAMDRFRRNPDGVSDDYLWHVAAALLAQASPKASRRGKLNRWADAIDALRGAYPTAAPSDALALAQWLHATEEPDWATMTVEDIVRAHRPAKP